MSEKPSLAKRFITSAFQKPAFQPVMLNGSKGGLFLFRDGKLKYVEGFKNSKFHVDDVTDVSLESGAQAVQRTSLTRTGGGAAAGLVIFGPVGALIGAGAGAVAKKHSGGEMYLTVETSDAAYLVQVPPKQIANAQQLAHQLRAHMAGKQA